MAPTSLLAPTTAAATPATAMIIAPTDTAVAHAGRSTTGATRRGGSSRSEPAARGVNTLLIFTRPGRISAGRTRDATRAGTAATRLARISAAGTTSAAATSASGAM